jgi:hypothetical protein
MKEILFITTNPNRNNPRSIRISNIVRNLQEIAPEHNYSVLSFSDKIKTESLGFLKENMFNLIFLLFRYAGILQIFKKISRISKLLDPFVLVHFLIKWDIKIRLQKIKDTSKVVFVVVVSPFSNYLFVPWLRKNYPNAVIILDIGDPLYNNSARWNDDEVSRSIEFEALNLSNSLLVTNHATKKHFITLFNINPSGIHIIPQGVNVELIERKLRNSVTKKKSMVYAGSFYSVLRSPEALFGALSCQDDYTLNVFGSNPKMQFRNVFFHNSLDQEKLFERMAQHDVLVFLDNKTGIQTSGKIFELVAFKKLILFVKGDGETDTYHWAKGFKNFIFCENNKNSILRAISEIETFRDLELNYDTYSFSWRTRAESYLKLF